MKPADMPLPAAADMAPEELLAAVRSVARSTLAEQVDAIDREGFYPRAVLQELARLGAMSAHLAAPHGRGDYGLAIRAMAEVSKVCGATGFMMWCQAVCGLYMEASGQPALTGEALTAHAAGAGLGGTALSNPMKSYAQIEGLLLKAVPREGGGYVVNGTLPWVRPDGKAQVTIEYAYGKPKRIHTVLVSTQHAPEIDNEAIKRDIYEHVIKPVLPQELVGENRKIVINPAKPSDYNSDDLVVYINPTGRFVVGGPMGDAGVTGRKIIVDTYGGMGRHGGGAFSGKDPTKVDRSAAYAARWVAKNLVAAGLADRCEVQVAYAIGVAHPLSINVETFGTSELTNEELVDLINEHFDLRPGAIIRDLKLRRPIYRATASFGHFGRDDIEAPWENTDKAEALRAAAGLRQPIPA